MTNQHHAHASRRTAAWIVSILALGTAGCTQYESPGFRLNLQGRDPASYQLSSGAEEDRQAEIAELEEEIAALEKSDSQGNRYEIQQLQWELDLREQAEINGPALQTIANVLEAAFGTPDNPYVYPELGLDLQKIKLAAGPVFRRQRRPADAAGEVAAADAAADPAALQTTDLWELGGLYRQHCVHCHGVTGEGDGPTAAFLNPYPRDYRKGVFKFKSTERAMPPSDEDLRRILVDGITGTAMPSFALLPKAEVDALVEYVKYLAIRGEVENELNLLLINAEEELELTREAVLEMVIVPVVERWLAAADGVVSVEESPRPAWGSPEWLASVAEGDRLFHSDAGGCAKCHGPTGLGDGSDPIFDDWNKDKRTPELLKQLLAAQSLPDAEDREFELFRLEHLLEVDRRSWDLPPQEIVPRNLRLGAYRGGRRPVDFYRRIYSGIAGTPMPAAGKSAANPNGLAPEQIWAIVDYLRSLPYEELSDTPAQVSHPSVAGGYHP